ncbi:OLC1v1007853C1 [Oldenlandia corymbosa var. corymbosa]|uniref:OLC1v1007853C1 n=1 Tax=Oldenlandia corymbosa var. corymbosa TaxID=529605 RepID=A0AAV1DK64_OLDCO|nr:OLC1v1007853C1 [Oldenlandia corymbosa var. corymbosa]
MEKEKEKQTQSKENQNKNPSDASKPIYARLKLFIDTKNHRVIYAQVDKDDLEALFMVLVAPVSLMYSSVTVPNGYGNLGSFFCSMMNLFGPCIGPVRTIGSFTVPFSFEDGSTIDLSVPIAGLPGGKLYGESKAFYQCGENGCARNFCNEFGVVCPDCGRPMRISAKYVPSPPPAMEGVSSFMVLDDLKVMPSSTVSALDLLKKLNLTESDGLEERIVDIGDDELGQLMATSKETNNVLNAVFLHVFIT